MKHPALIPAFVLFFSLAVATLGAAPRELFNGRDLSGWETFVDDPAIPAAAVFSVTPEGYLRIAGKPAGLVRTEDIFQNYRLIVEWRWVDAPGNSGVLLHSQGPNRIWPLCVEAQLHHEKAGDVVFIGVGSGGQAGTESRLVRDPEQPYAVLGRQQSASEHAPGEWNRYEIIADGTTLTLIVNDVLQNEVEALTLTSGAICLQSEGAPIEFRRLSLEPLEERE